ncbi:uncharacterized protein LOC130693108 [Daphnia carinata]|uniref:uncharacterized protein LOC130693108 n=1 Tax=Daphnia carinata TaxID=120202 RepID=UPI002579CD54|nr:uncharacterized protein LOC130693108 [Daphnia carinata]
MLSRPRYQYLRYLTVSEILDAKTMALRLDQGHYFATELVHLKNGKTLPPSSKLNNVSPFTDNEGILRVRGRLERGDFAEFLKHPVILHYDSSVTQLVITEAHNRIQHKRIEHTIAALRSEYYILRFRHTVQRVLSKCLICRHNLASPQIPLMAALPANRLQSHLPPFTLTDIDFFGPYDVVIRRKCEKRYGVLFTCMITRAVHIEMACALNTESILLSFWRFANRRGCRSEIQSDNGTNLTSGSRELQVALQSLNTKAVADRLARRSIKLNFNPPAAPHFGGSWERLIQSTKKALSHVLNGQTFTDDSLFSAFVAVENLLNGRPLTYVAIDPREPAPLTPNHFCLDAQTLSLYQTTKPHAQWRPSRPGTAVRQSRATFGTDGSANISLI